jgi:cyclic pyranopterin phosphate synthase
MVDSAQYLHNMTTTRDFNPQFDSQKIVYHSDWLRRWKQDPFSVPPIYIEVSPIGQCNHRCTFCAKEVMGYPDRSLSRELLESWIDELGNLRSEDPDNLGVRTLMFAGEGEPTLHVSLPQIIAAARKNDIEVALTTNGTGLTERFCVQSLKNISWIKASVNAGTQATYSLVHQAPPAHWDIVWRNLSRAVELRARYGYQCEIGCQSVLLVNDTLDVKDRLVPANWREAVLLARRAKEIGLDHVVIKPYGQNPYSQGTQKRYGTMSYSGFLKELEAIEEELRELETPEFTVVFRWKAFLDYETTERRYETCLATPMTWAYLQSDGMVISCAAHNGNPDFDLGNIKDKSFQEIWWGERRRQHIEFMQQFDVSACRRNCRMHNVNEALHDLSFVSDASLEEKLIQISSGPIPKNVNFI